MKKEKHSLLQKQKLRTLWLWRFNTKKLLKTMCRNSQKSPTGRNLWAIYTHKVIDVARAGSAQHPFRNIINIVKFVTKQRCEAPNKNSSPLHARFR